MMEGGEEVWGHTGVLAGSLLTCPGVDESDKPYQVDNGWDREYRAHEVRRPRMAQSAP